MSRRFCFFALLPFFVQILFRNLPKQFFCRLANILRWCASRRNLLHHCYTSHIKEPFASSGLLFHRLTSFSTSPVITEMPNLTSSFASSLLINAQLQKLQTVFPPLPAKMNVHLDDTNSCPQRGIRMAKDSVIASCRTILDNRTDHVDPGRMAVIVLCGSEK